ncbi:MAG TPA: KUP/HAK/KT family potassium transporter, partial [Bacteroidia bacterium]
MRGPFIFYICPLLFRSVQQGHHSHLNRVTAAGLLVTLGIIFGDIGTSPLYVLKAIIGDRPVSPELVKGGLSCIFWTLTLQTTIKYVILALRADNKGEGGIFSLYTLVKRMKVKWLIVPAMIGGSALLADGIITPSISVTSAVEGLDKVVPHIERSTILTVVIIILTTLFFLQQFGTRFVGKSFGPVMLVWFLMLGALGIACITRDPGVLDAMNPLYAYRLLAEYPEGYWLLGAVFLCTTGAEALYSDLGHCGRKNIRVSWIFVKAMLLLNYFGQGAWLLSEKAGQIIATYKIDKQTGQVVVENGKKVIDHVLNPFYESMPHWFLYIGLFIATAAAIVASQALISASFTLINEAMRLNFWPKLRIVYPTETRGQMYIPAINWFLFAGCLGIVLGFQSSSNMEAAYGLTINFDMLMTTTLLTFYMIMRRYTWAFIVWFVLTYYLIEFAFLTANLDKFPHGGWVSFMISIVLIFVMATWFFARKIRNRYVEFVKVDDYLPLLADLNKDLSIPKYATHLVYLTSADKVDEIEAKVIYSILQKQPKRADTYWFVHVDVKDEPYRMDYRVTKMLNDDIIRIDFKLGFRVAPRVNRMFRQVVQDMVKKQEVDITSRYESLNRNNVIGDFRFVVIEKFLSLENELPFFEKIILDIYFVLKHLSLSEERAFG